MERADSGRHGNYCAVMRRMVRKSKQMQHGKISTEVTENSVREMERGGCNFDTGINYLPQGMLMERAQ